MSQGLDEGQKLEFQRFRAKGNSRDLRELETRCMLHAACSKVGKGTFGRVRLVKIKGSTERKDGVSYGREAFRSPMALKILRKADVIRLKQAWPSFAQGQKALGGAREG